MQTRTHNSQPRISTQSFSLRCFLSFPLSQKDIEKKIREYFCEFFTCVCHNDCNIYSEVKYSTACVCMLSLHCCCRIFVSHMCAFFCLSFLRIHKHTHHFKQKKITNFLFLSPDFLRISFALRNAKTQLTHTHTHIQEKTFW